LYPVVRFDHAKEGVADLATQKCSSWVSETDPMKYDLIETPFPLDDRDFVTKTVTTFDKKNANGVLY